MAWLQPRSMSNTPIDSLQFFEFDFDSKAQPDFRHERWLNDHGAKCVCGMDEAGRGPLAGPVTAAAVILDPNNIPEGLHDSKKLSEKKRSALFFEILNSSIVSFANIGAPTIDKINIREASLLAMSNCVHSLNTNVDFALIDGNALPHHLPCPAAALVKGDARSLSIAAASIVAKVVRDQMMIELDKHYQGYGLAGHKGYPTKAHREAVLELGPSAIHRRSFAPVASALNKKKPGSEI